MGITSTRIAQASEARSSFMDAVLAARRPGSVTVTPSSAHTIPAFDAAVGIAADAVAQLRCRVWTGEGAGRRRADWTWQARLLSQRPNAEQDTYTFWWVVEASLTARRNAYIWKVKRDGRVVALVALHPDQVRPHRDGQGRVVYDVAFAEAYPLPPDVSGYGVVTVGRDVVLHIRGRGGIGEIEAPSPIKAFAASLGVALSKVEHELSVFTNGAQGGLVVTFPQNVTREQAERWRDQFESVHAGPTNAGRTKVLGNGASITQIGMTMAEAQFVESVNLSVADIARILNVPAWLLGVGDKTQRPLSPEHEMQRWLYQGLGPRLARIESALNNDSDLFLASPFFAGFDTNDVVRGDLITEDTIAHQQIQDGRLLVDEWRLEHGRDPLPGGVGMIPQITPVGGAPNPNLSAAMEGTQDEPV